jgi:hypothetical protein
MRYDDNVGSVDKAHPCFPARLAGVFLETLPKPKVPVHQHETTGQSIGPVTQRRHRKSPKKSLLIREFPVTIDKIHWWITRRPETLYGDI